MPQLVFVACITAIAFAATDLLAYASLSNLLLRAAWPSFGALVLASASSCLLLHSGAMEAHFEFAALYGALWSLAIVDLHTGYVPNAALVPLIVLAIVHLFLGDQLFLGIFGSLLVGGLALTLHVSGNGSGFGLGDVKLLALLGSIIGAVRSLTVFGTACIIGAVIGLLLLAVGRISRRDALPFVPILGLAFLLQIVAYAG